MRVLLTMSLASAHLDMTSVLLRRLLLALADVELETSNWARIIDLAQAASRAAQDAEVKQIRVASSQWHPAVLHISAGC
jgi:hypothetical protein